ncbi:type II/IV secretion system protein [Aestuariibacter halophilus]|uniref:Type II/IV secretion system protein n=1 Tax=Fluctibacter halophilus TaxID=226011 RepID=A0ABS8G2J7_9ALTE|nr:ATPase, T2SS/T4P/T4SS family [Aestuariibacter halophilus]MCC2614804.1 type II/IV secretion system protein [Aestuariibacter halophilus]
MSSAIVEVLQRHGVNAQDIDKAISYQSKHGGQIEQLLVNLGALAEEELPHVYGDLLGCSVVLDASDLPSLTHADSPSLNHHYLAHRHWFLLGQREGTLVFAAQYPMNRDAKQYLALEGVDYDLIVIAADVAESLRQTVVGSTDSQDALEDSLLSDVEEDKLRELASEAPVVNLLNSLIAKGLKLGASDMHVEPVKGRCRVRYRIDGVLHDSETIPKRLELPVVSRLKILSNMDIAEKRRPQDGKIEIKIANVELDIRVSALPLNEGESIVLRFLRKDSIRYDMDVLGIAADIRQKLAEDLKSTAGVILLTGPTGSGKTTSLYTFLNELNDDDVKIITLEDPVEYQLEGINQVQVNNDIGFDFASGLRSIVRQDPDIIMLGEIRDKETANIAMQSALTGHLVFSTVHTNDAPSAFTRLLDLGVEEFLLNAAIVSIVAQRLARKLCDNCKQPDPNAQALIEQYQLQDRVKGPISLYHPVGCEACAHSGYKGRTAIIEYLRCDDDIKSLPKDHQFIQRARAHNQQQGHRTLLQDGLLKASEGITSIEEVIRVAG